MSRIFAISARVFHRVDAQLRERGVAGAARRHLTSACLGRSPRTSGRLCRRSRRPLCSPFDDFGIMRPHAPAATISSTITRSSGFFRFASAWSNRRGRTRRSPVMSFSRGRIACRRRLVRRTGVGQFWSSSGTTSVTHRRSPGRRAGRASPPGSLLAVCRKSAGAEPTVSLASTGEQVEIGVRLTVSK